MANSWPSFEAVILLDANGDQITSFGGSGGTSATDDAAFTAGSGSGTPIMGFVTADSVDSGDVGVVGMSTDRRLLTDAQLVGQDADINIADGGNAITVDWAGTAPPIGAGTEAAALRVTLATDSTGVLSIDDNSGSITIDGTVTANLSATDNAVLDDIAAAVHEEDEASANGHSGMLMLARRTATPADTSGTDLDYEVPQMDNGRLWVSATVDAALPAGDNNIGNVDIVTLPASTNTLEVVGDVAADAADAGNPVSVGGVAVDVDTTAPPTRVTAESDRTNFATDFDGALFARPHGPELDDYHLDTSSAQTDTSVFAAPGAALSTYVTDIVFTHDGTAAINAFFEESTTTVLGPYYLPATAGGVHIQFQTPKKVTANTALTITTSASHAHAVDVTGFIGQG